MTRVCIYVALLMCFPLAAAAQTPPPAPPAPAPVAVPVPPVPPVPVVAPPVIEPFAMIDPLPVIDPIDLEMQIQDAMLASRRALEELDVQALTHEALQGIDVEGLKAQAKAQSDAMKERSEALKQQMKDQAEAMKERAKAAAKEGADRALQMKDFSYQMRGPDNININMAGRDGDSVYSGGLNYVNRRQYEQAITRFDQAITQKSAHADGALYWKAYSQVQARQE